MILASFSHQETWSHARRRENGGGSVLKTLSKPFLMNYFGLEFPVRAA